MKVVLPRVGVIDDVEPRLVTTSRRESLEQYRSAGGYRDLPDGAVLLDAVEASGLRGRGGASFPTGRKIRAVREGRGTPVVVANGEEGEPMSVKDRWLLRTRPHLVVDGLRHAVAATGADLAYVYVSDDLSAGRVVDAIAELGSVPFDLRVVQVAPSYVAGEETAVVRFIDGGPAKPSDKPPRPFVEGVQGRPTMISNVETLANLPVITRLGSAAYRVVGSDRAPGTFLSTIGGAVSAPGLYELPLGVPLDVAIQTLTGPVDPPVGVLVGGYFGGLLAAEKLAVPLDYDTLSARGSGLGCGAITVLGPDDCPVDAADEVLAYFARENAAQCGSCFNGTAAMSAAVRGLRVGVAGEGDLDRLAHWTVRLRGRGACGTLDGAAQLAASLLREFPDEVRAHLMGTTCAPCARPPADDPAAPFAVPVPVAEDELQRV